MEWPEEKLRNVEVEKFTFSEPIAGKSNNWYGNVLLAGSKVVLCSDRIKQLPSQYAFRALLTRAGSDPRRLWGVDLRVYPNASEYLLQAFEAIDQFMENNADFFKTHCDEEELTDLQYHPLVQCFTRKSGEPGKCLDFRFRTICLDNPDTIKFTTMFKDQDDLRYNVSSITDIQDHVGQYFDVMVKFCLEYTVKKDYQGVWVYQLLPRVYYMKTFANQDPPEFIRSSSSLQQGGTSSALRITDILANNDQESFASKVSFKLPGEDQQSKQKYLRFFYDETPRIFHLEDTTITKERDDPFFVGLPPPSNLNGDDENVNRSVKLKILAADANLEFFQWLDGAITNKLDEVKGLFDLPDRVKLGYNPILPADEDAPIVRFTVNDRTVFYDADKNVIPYDGTVDILPLHSRLQDIVIAVSKIWYDMPKKACVVKLTLKSCQIIAPTNMSVAYGTFDD